jgi:transposase-like protein/DDE family transposase
MSIEQSEWIRKTWADANLGDRRRNQRAIQLATDLLSAPESSLPKVTMSWGDLKGAYRLLNEKDVSHKVLQQNHWTHVFNSANEHPGIVLFIQDGSILDYSSREATMGLGPIGDHEGKGINLHSCLAVGLGKNTPSIFGLAYQAAWIRSEIVKCSTETKSQRRKRSTEADVWSSWIPKIDRGQRNSPWVFVGDRGNDIFKFIDICQQRGWDCVYRACQNRVIIAQGKTHYLMPWARSLNFKTTKQLILRSRNGVPARIVELKVSWETIEIQPPQLEKKDRKPISAWCVRCWNDEEKLEWILISTIPVLNNSSAIEKADWYAHRWIIEEYHKCLKTGCSIEKRRLRTAEGLIALLGILGIIATKLLELRSISRETEQIPAEKVIPEIFLRIVRIKLHLGDSPLTVNAFWKQVARLGGFLARRSDGDPGWQTLWGGWIRLLDMAWVLENCG